MEAKEYIVPWLCNGDLAWIGDESSTCSAEQVTVAYASANHSGRVVGRERVLRSSPKELWSPVLAICHTECESHVSTVLAGTFWYIPPENSQTTVATTKGDVYSFGVVMLEL
ncbi:hypothetical protein LguiA_029867 [Lonicera macranthoides]